MNSVRERSIKIRTAQGTNQNAPFHLGPVQPCNKHVYRTILDCSWLSYDGPNRGMRIHEKHNFSCPLRLTACIQLLPNRILFGSVESPLSYDGFVFVTRISLSQMYSSLRFLFGFRTKSNISELTKNSALQFV